MVKLNKKRVDNAKLFVKKEDREDE